METKIEKVGVIGLGIIGSRVSECLRRRGHEVYVWSRSPKPIPHFLGSAAEVAALADTVQIFVSDSKALAEVIDRIRDRLESRHTVIANGTFDPEAVAETFKKVQATGAAFLDAPFTGSRNAAEAGQLVYYIGGDARVLERVRPILEASAKSILHLGRVGEASLLKIATNMISATTVGILAESYALVAKAGIDPARLLEALEQNACYSTLVGMKLPGIIARDYEPHFSLKHMFKDTQYAIGLAKQLELEMPVLTTTASVLYRSIQKRRGDADYSVVASPYQDHNE